MDQREHNQMLIAEFLNLRSRMRFKNFEGVVGSKQFEDVNEINRATKRAKPFLVHCKSSDLGAIEVASQVNANRIGSFHLAVSIFPFLKMNINQISNLIKKYIDQVTFLTLAIFFDGGVEVETQERRIGGLLETLQFRDKEIKLNLGVHLNGDVASSLELERVRLECLAKVYQAGFTIIRLDIDVHGKALVMQEQWTALENIVKESAAFAQGVMVLKQAEGDINLDNVLGFLMHFWEGKSQLQLPPSIYGDFSYSKLQQCVIFIVDKVYYESTYYVNEESLSLETKLEDFVKVLTSLKHPGQIRQLILLRRSAYQDHVYFSQEEEQVVLDGLENSLLLFPNLFKVLISGRELFDLGQDGSRIHELFLQPREAGYMQYLIESRRTARYNRGKVLVLGDGGAGKTSTIKSWAGEDSDRDHNMTVVAERSEVIQSISGGWERIPKSSVSTFARDLKFVSASLLESKGNTSQLKLPDCTMKPTVSFPKDSTYKVFKSAVDENKSLVPLLTQMGNATLTQELSNLDNPMKITFWDFGGQQIFDILHPLYLTDKAIYFLVFNPQKFAQDIENEGSRLQRWLASISLYASNASVLLIGTRGQSLESTTIDAVDKALDSLLSEFYDLEIITNDASNLWFFPVENSMREHNLVYMKPVKDAVRRVMTADESEGAWNQKVDLSWLFFMNQLHAEGEKVMSLASIEIQAISYGFSQEEARQIVDFFNSAGSILDFSQYFPPPLLSVVLKPEWFLSTLGRMIMAREGSDIQRMAKKKKDGSRFFAPFLRETGILASTLLKNLIESDGSSGKIAEFIAALCEKKLIMTALKQLPSSYKIPLQLRKSNTYWILPSFFQEELKPMTPDRGEGQTVSKEILWADLVPMSLFGNFACSVIKAGEGMGCFELSELKKNALRASLNETQFEIRFDSSARYLLIIHSTDASAIDGVSRLCKMAYGEVCKMKLLRDISATCEFCEPEI